MSPPAPLPPRPESPMAQPPRFGTLLVQFYGLSAAANREQELMQRRYLRRQSQYEDLLAENQPLIDDPQPALEALRRFLDGLHDDALQAVAALMAAGADGVEDAFVHWRSVRRLLTTRSAMVEAVLLHQSRAEHVRLALAGCAPLPVDDLPRRFGRIGQGGLGTAGLLSSVLPIMAILEESARRA